MHLGDERSGFAPHDLKRHYKYAMGAFCLAILFAVAGYFRMLLSMPDVIGVLLTVMAAFAIFAAIGFSVYGTVKQFLNSR